MTEAGVNRLLVLCLLSLETFTVEGGWWDTRFDLPGPNGAVGRLVEFRGAIYAVAGFTRIAGVDAPYLARWDGTNWAAIHPGLNALVGSAVATDEAIYFGAVQQRLDQPSGLLRWDGQTWTALGAPPGYGQVIPLLRNGTDIYAQVFPDSSSGSPWVAAGTRVGEH